MPSFKRPGIYINEVLTPTDVSPAGSTTDAIFLGEHFRGPTDKPVYVTSWGQFVANYGGFPAQGTTATELPYALYNYFSNGGRGAHVCRVIGTGSAVATTTLDDREGTPVATLRVDANSPGEWGNNLRVNIVDRDAPNGRFDLIVLNGGTTDAFIVERWTDLSMDDTDGRYVESIINSLTGGSAYITVTDLDSASVAPNDTPAVIAGDVLTGGLVGTAATTSEKTDAVTATTTLMDQVVGLATVNYPGETESGVISGLITYCEDRGDLFAVVDPVAGASVATAVSYAAGFSPASSYGGVYYPWITVKDANSSAPGTTRLCPPGAFICGKYAETDTVRGVWKAPAGLNTSLTGVLALEQKLTNPQLDTLNDGHVNAIRQIPGGGVSVMGARTLKKGTSDKYVNVRRTLNYIKDALTTATAFAIFENNDQALWNRLTAVCERFLAETHAQGGLRGNSPNEAFYVKCDDELNTPAVIASGEVKIEIGVALQHPAEFIVIRLGQWEGGASASDG